MAQTEMSPSELREHEVNAEPPRHLNLLTATMLVVASMVGVGIFTTTGLLIRDLPSPGVVLAAWALGGGMALCAALAYAELVAALPCNGGEYQLLSRVYHPALGFLAGWTSLVVGFSAPVAAAAIAFGEYLGRCLPGTPPIPTAIILVLCLSALHASHVSFGRGTQNLFTLTKIFLIGALIAGGIWQGKPALLTKSVVDSQLDLILSPAFGVGLIYVAFAYSGWNAAAYVAGETQDPARNLPRALLYGTTIVTALYLGLNVVFLMAVPASQLAGVIEVGHVAAAGLFGEQAGRALSAIIAIGLVSTVGALIMTGARVYESMGVDYRRLRILAVRPPLRGPVAAIVLQAGLAIVMILTASFDQLLLYIGVTLSVFTALTVGGVFVLRMREPNLPRPYRTWGHPFTTAAAIAFTLWMAIYAVVAQPTVLIASGITLALGVALYFFLRRDPRR